MLAGHSFSDVKTRYSQTEREAAVVWACEHFNRYTSGAPFKVVTDHQPLLGIWRKPNLTLRIARWVLRFQPYDLNLEYRPGKDNPADYMSRHPSSRILRSSREQKIAEEYVNLICDTSTPIAVTILEMQLATQNDQTLQVVVDLVRHNNWDSINRYQGHSTIDFEALKSFRGVKDNLTVNADGNLLLHDTRLVVPMSLCHHIIRLAQSLIRSKV